MHFPHADGDELLDLLCDHRHGIGEAERSRTDGPSGGQQDVLVTQLVRTLNDGLTVLNATAEVAIRHAQVFVVI